MATYGAIADSDGGAAAPGAYYLLNQRRLIGPRGSMVADEEMDGRTCSLADTWIDLVTDVARPGGPLQPRARRWPWGFLRPSA